jgi:glycosyltransferase involved in cell wall biosynthesis
MWICGSLKCPKGLIVKFLNFGLGISNGCNLNNAVVIAAAFKENSQLMDKINRSSDRYDHISVAIATYNGEKYLQEQLDSILTQTLKPDEIIVCDDRSTDETVAILEKYRQAGLLTYYVNESRLGFIGNFKRAVSLTREDNYVALSDQDDIWLPEKLQAAAEVMRKLDDGRRPAMVYSDLVFVDQDKNLLNPSFRNELGQDGYRHCLDTLLFGGFVNGCTMLMDPLMRKYFATIPDKSTLIHDTWIALIAYTFGHAGIVPYSLIHYRKHAANATNVSGFQRKNRFQKLKEELSMAFKNNDMFEDHFACVQEFYETFHENLSDDQKRLITRVMKLRGRTYLEKRIAFRIFARGKWL